VTGSIPSHSIASDPRSVIHISTQKYWHWLKTIATEAAKVTTGLGEKYMAAYVVLRFMTNVTCRLSALDIRDQHGPIQCSKVLDEPWKYLLFKVIPSNKKKNK